MSWEVNERVAKYFERSSGLLSGDRLEVIFKILDHIFKVVSWIIAVAAIYYVYLKTGNYLALAIGGVLYILLLWFFFNAAFFLRVLVFSETAKWRRVVNTIISLLVSMGLFLFLTTTFETMVQQLASLR
ncbi:hypothetical protein ACJ4V0_01915 [Phreatobacter sp. HK31-P]